MIDEIVDDHKLALRNRLRAVLVVGDDRHVACALRVANRAKLRFWQGEYDRNRVLLGERGYEGRCVVCPDDISWVDGAKPNAARKWRRYGCVAEIGLGGIDRGFVRLDERTVDARPSRSS